MKRVITGDGSSTLYVPEFDEHHHSTFGAVTESMHVYIKAGLQALNPHKQTVSIFEAGFGCGLNALLTCLEAIHKKRAISYYAAELYPVSAEMVSQLNYPEIVGENSAALFSAMHAADWNTAVEVHKYFTLFKISTDLTSYVPRFSYDAIYYDAFAPDKQPELWSQEIFSRLYKQLNPGGLIITYCAKGVVRRRMVSAGFQMERLPGPPGKREILRGWKKNNPPA
jgi:tRNA U34 5-methylaminomethyl-2-thiouridine-forming methyltransferase MnmC